jgi:hypothetical protein
MVKIVLFGRLNGGEDDHIKKISTTFKQDMDISYT